MLSCLPGSRFIGTDLHLDQGSSTPCIAAHPTLTVPLCRRTGWYWLQGPQLVVIVPQRELGVQICLLIYKLFGGSLSSRLPGDQANMFTYTGPRGLKVGASWH